MGLFVIRNKQILNQHEEWGMFWGMFTWIAQDEGLTIPSVHCCPVQLFQATHIKYETIILYINWLRRSYGGEGKRRNEFAE